MGMFDFLFGSSTENVDYKVGNDGTVYEIHNKGDKTDIYYYDKNAQFENDPKHRDHGHVVFKNERVAMVRNDHGDKYNFDKDGNDDSSKSSSSCYIATATLVYSGSEVDLNLLRQWRDTVLLKNRIGFCLVTHYHRTGPGVAAVAKQNRLLAASFLFPFVRPALWLIKWQTTTRLATTLRDIAVATIFSFGLLYGTFIWLVLGSRRTNKI
jgi:hypothetical protein